MADLLHVRVPKTDNNYLLLAAGADFIGPFATNNNGNFSLRYILLFTSVVTGARIEILQLQQQRRHSAAYN